MPSLKTSANSRTAISMISGFTCLPNLRANEPNACGSKFASDGFLSLDVLSYVSGVPTSVGVMTWAYRSADLVYAKGLEPTSTATTAPATGTTTTSVASQTQFMSTTDTPSPRDSSSGDSTSSDDNSSRVGKGVGIIVAVGIVVLLLMVGLSVAMYQCGKRRGIAVANTNVKQVSDIGQVYDGTTEQWRSAHELEEQRQIQELRASRDQAELSG
ncbi:hypothetical protein F5Y03DRAFT_398564 [Xylaria venustula]|nr:hypothetical protein F5Y03DRAFT_398564 [Xylaria venustula]